MENERNLPEIPIAMDERECDLISSNLFGVDLRGEYADRRFLVLSFYRGI